MNDLEISRDLGPELSIVSTLYLSSPFLKEFVEVCCRSLDQINCHNFEIILVNDGSPDDSLETAVKLQEQFKEIVIIDLSRNFGHHKAAHAGLKYASGQYIFFADCDLEVSPSVLVDFYKTMLEKDADVVYGFQQTRKGSWFERYSGEIFWNVFNSLCETKVPANVCTERLMKRNYVSSLMELGDKDLFMAGMMYWTGFKQIGIPVVKTQRKTPSTYSFFRRVSLLVNAITSFSAAPLTLMLYFGVGTTAVSFILGAYFVLRDLIFHDVLLGFTSLATMITFSLGVMTSCLGIIGVYLGKVFNQVQNRPVAIIKNIYR